MDLFSMNFFTIMVKLGSEGLDLSLDRSEGLDLTSAREEDVWPVTWGGCRLNSVDEEGSEKCEDVEDRES